MSNTQKPNPQRLKDPNGNKLNSENVDAFKRTDCLRYDHCVDIAIINDWRQFHCNNCQAFAGKSPEQQKEDKLLVFLGQSPDR